MGTAINSQQVLSNAAVPLRNIPRFCFTTWLTCLQFSRAFAWSFEGLTGQHGIATCSSRLCSFAAYQILALAQSKKTHRKVVFVLAGAVLDGQVSHNRRRLLVLSSLWFGSQLSDAIVLIKTFFAQCSFRRRFSSCSPELCRKWVLISAPLYRLDCRLTRIVCGWCFLNVGGDVLNPLLVGMRWLRSIKQWCFWTFWGDWQLIRGRIEVFNDYVPN